MRISGSLWSRSMSIPISHQSSHTLTHVLQKKKFPHLDGVEPAHVCIFIYTHTHKRGFVNARVRIHGYGQAQMAYKKEKMVNQEKKNCALRKEENFSSRSTRRSLLLLPKFSIRFGNTHAPSCPQDRVEKRP